jgi:hypothetical protein
MSAGSGLIKLHGGGLGGSSPGLIDVEASMNTSEMAQKLGTDQRELRRFLRADPSYTNAAHTSAGRYNFTDQDIPVLRKRFTAWQSKNVNRKKRVRVVAPVTPASVDKVDRPTPSADGTPGLPVDILNRKLFRTERERRDQLSRERAERLDAMLLANGHHLSQLRERENVS